MQAIQLCPGTLRLIPRQLQIAAQIRDTRLQGTLRELELVHRALAIPQVLSCRFGFLLQVFARYFRIGIAHLVFAEFAIERLEPRLGLFPARPQLFGMEREGVNLLAEDGVHNKGSEITTGYPQFDHVLLKKLGWWDELTDEEKKEAEGKTWANDISGGIQRVAMKHGCTPFGNAKARAVVWNFPDGIPQHREPLFSPRPDMVEKYPTHDDVKVFWRLPTLFKSVQQQAVKEEVHKKFPLILTSGRLVEYEGGGEETRSNPWLAELMQDNFVEINPKAAADRGIRNGEYVWVSTPSGARIKVKAKITEGVGPDTVFIPFHFSGWWQGEDMLPYYPEGAAPIVRGEAVNTATTYGYDRITLMQETKTTLCQVAKFQA